MSNEIMVSIICNAYNHEQYIEDALKSFVMQRTNFKFEVLVHDDASTDNTANIIREYENKYPNLIKPIYQTENQYSKKQGLVSKIQYGRAKGKYIALCEGDDYWTDPFKLQKQFDAMEANPEIDICAHAATKTNENGVRKRKIMAPSSENCILTLPQVIFGGGSYVSTNTLFYRREMDKSMPEFRKFMYLDYTMQIHGAIRGGMLYLKDNMSVYRGGVKDSWTDRMSKNRESFRQHSNKCKEMLKIFDKEFDYKYSEVVKKTILRIDFNNLYKESDISRIRKYPYREFYDMLSPKQKIKICVLGTIAKLSGVKGEADGK